MMKQELKRVENHINFGSIDMTREEERNLYTQTNKEVSEFDYNGHQYIRFKWGVGDHATCGVVHNPDCPCFNNNSVK